MRIVIDVKKGEPAQVVLNNLYKHTQLQDTFGVILLAIVEQRPRVLNLLDACEHFIDFRRMVVRRRTAYELRKAEARAHILEGYVIALDHLFASLGWQELACFFRFLQQHEQLPAGSLAFLLCGVPVVYRLADTARIRVHADGAEAQWRPGNALGPELSAALFRRDGTVKRIDVEVEPDRLR